MAQKDVLWQIRISACTGYNAPVFCHRFKTLFRDAGGNRMVEQQIPLKFTRSGKWELVAITTRSVINAGNNAV
ncbi:hypothetical protein [Niabella hirudinis]|uniref:hypothetical protein n=1 Tax=Niabella hirudinis TaxID=1285929 RepID=UPI003EC14B62